MRETRQKFSSIYLHQQRNILYFLFYTELETIKDELTRDKEVMRRSFFAIDTTTDAREKPPLQCTFDDEMKPPAERPSIQEMIKLGGDKPRYTKQWNPKTGLDYYPFHR